MTTSRSMLPMSWAKWIPGAIRHASASRPRRVRVSRTRVSGAGCSSACIDGMKRSRAPQHEVGDPAHVVDELMVVGPREQRIVVGAVGGKQRNGARGEQIEGPGPSACIHRQPDQGRQQEDVAQRIGDRHELGEQGQPREMDVRRNEEHPRQQREADGEDQRVDDGGAIAVRVAPAHEQQKPAEQRRIDKQVDRVARGRKSDDAAEQRGVRVGVEVARDVEHLADEQQAPRQHRLRPVHTHPGGDRQRGHQPDQVDETGVALERRHEHIRQREQRGDGEIPAPDELPPEGTRARHAAALFAGCRSKAFASLPSTSIS